MRRAIQLTGLIVILLGISVACSKEEKRGSVSIRMVDQPIAFEEVNVEIRQVKVNYEDRYGPRWINLDTRHDVYNLLELQNGVSTTLVDEHDLPAGHISQMRLVLGNENTVKVAGSHFPLTLSSQDETGLKLKLDTEIRRGDKVDILFDFDAEKSIVVEGNGAYRLKPVLHLIHVKRY